MSVSCKYWDDCVDPEDMRLMWMDTEVSKEWIDAGEQKGQKVHLSRDPDGQAYLTQTEMRAVAAITVQRHFNSQLDPTMICSLAEIVSSRQLFIQHDDRKAKETRVGIMQVSPEIAQWLGRDIGYRYYNIEDDVSLLYRPFINVYFGTAYAKWLFSCDGKQRNEEFVIRAYKAGKKKASHKSSAQHYKRYLSVKETLMAEREQMGINVSPLAPDGYSSQQPTSSKSGDNSAYWDIRVSQRDMDEMWRHPDVMKEWTRSGERQGKVRFSHDDQKRPYLSRVEVKAVADIIISRHFSGRGVTSTYLAALAEVCSMRFVNGVRSRTGLMGIDYTTAFWLYKEMGFREYQVLSVDDLYNPFASMYFGAAYLSWLSTYEGRERSPEFIIQAYLGGGPQNVNLQETGSYWNKFQEALAYYGEPKRDDGSCCIL